MLTYWKKIYDNDIVYSCDMIRLSLQFDERYMQEIVGCFNNILRTDVRVYPISYKAFSYKTLITISYNDSSVALGVGFNGASRDELFKGFLEFNPNKVDCNLFWDDFCFIKSCCSNVSLVRWDLAIDVPIDILSCSLIKDQRRYALDMISCENKTEYLGVRNTAGRFKMYNKSIESNLPISLTRLELTCDGFWGSDDIIQHFPEVYCNNLQESISVLNSSDRWLYELLQTHPNKDYFFKTMPRRKKEKLKPFLYNSLDRFQLSLFCLSQLVFELNSIL